MKPNTVLATIEMQNVGVTCAKSDHSTGKHRMLAIYLKLISPRKLMFLFHFLEVSWVLFGKQYIPR